MSQIPECLPKIAVAASQVNQSSECDTDTGPETPKQPEALNPATLYHRQALASGMGLAEYISLKSSPMHYLPFRFGLSN